MSSTVVRNFDTWKKFLGERVLQAQKMGMSEDTISKLAYEIGDFLDEKVDPQNAANRTLKELWDVGNKEERQTIARLMVKLTKKNA
jgi:transcriptional antiterminator